MNVEVIARSVLCPCAYVRTNIEQRMCELGDTVLYTHQDHMKIEPAIYTCMYVLASMERALQI